MDTVQVLQTGYGASAALAFAVVIFSQLCDLPADTHYACKRIEGVTLRVHGGGFLQDKVKVSRYNSYP